MGRENGTDTKNGLQRRLGAFTICQQKPKIPVGNSNGTAHSTGKFLEKMESSEVFLFSRSNRNDWKNPVPFVNSHSTGCTSASFPAIRRCRCSRHFDLLLFSSSRESLGLGETPHRENPVPLRAFHSNRIFRANGKRPRF